MRNKKALLISTFLLVVCVVGILNVFAHSEGIANDFLKNKAEERAKIIDEKYGEDAYGGTADLKQKLETANREHDRYDEGYDKGYNEGYKARIEEASAERKKETKILMISLLVIVIFTLLIKFLNKNRKE